MKRIHLTHIALAAGVCATLAHAVFAASDRAERRRNNAPTSVAASAAATPAAISPANSFDAFQLIVERNIFNPNRVGRTRATPEEKPLRIEEISLVGTMNYDKGLVAFFESPDSAYRKVLREGESVADFKVQRIAADGVELTRDDKVLGLKVTQQLRRVEGSDWVVNATQSAPADTRPVATIDAARPADSTVTSEVPGDASEVLKRLMKKREKQFKQ